MVDDDAKKPSGKAAKKPSDKAAKQPGSSTRAARQGKRGTPKPPKPRRSGSSGTMSKLAKEAYAERDGTIEPTKSLPTKPLPPPCKMNETKLAHNQLVDPNLKDRVIASLGRLGTVTGACRDAACIIGVFYAWTDEEYSAKHAPGHYDPEFREACKRALAHDFRDRVLDTAYNRALDGWVKRTYDRDGNVTSEEHTYDSAILQQLLKRVDPGFQEPGVVINNLPSGEGGSSGAPVPTAAARKALLDSMTPEQKRLMARIIELEVVKQDDDDAIEGEFVER